MKLLALSLVLLGAGTAFGQTLTSVGQTYAQNFDTLASATSSTPWVNDSTLAGWSLFTKDSVAVTTYLGGTGSSNAGSFYSFGNSADRALGGLGSSAAYFGSPASGAVAGYIALALKNNTGTTLTSVDIKFDGEQWRNGGNTSAQTMALQYGFGSTFGAVATWLSPGGSFNWASPVVGATAAIVDGNVAGRVANVGGTLSALTWNDTDTLWFRWIENNDVGNDHGLAIDNLTVTAIPEPAMYALCSGLAGFAALLFRRQRRVLV